jgi:hypothetical protein
MKNLCRATLVAFALTLALAPAAQSKKPVPPPTCTEGKPCTFSIDCGCPRCGDFCVNGACTCAI